MPKHTQILLEQERFELKPKSGGGLLNYEVWGDKERGTAVFLAPPISEEMKNEWHSTAVRLN